MQRSKNSAITNNVEFHPRETLFIYVTIERIRECSIIYFIRFEGSRPAFQPLVFLAGPPSPAHCSYMLLLTPLCITNSLVPPSCFEKQSALFACLLRENITLKIVGELLFFMMVTVYLKL